MRETAPFSAPLLCDPRDSKSSPTPRPGPAAARWPCRYNGCIPAGAGSGRGPVRRHPTPPRNSCPTGHPGQIVQASHAPSWQQQQQATSTILRAGARTDQNLHVQQQQQRQQPASPPSQLQLWPTPAHQGAPGSGPAGSVPHPAAAAGRGGGAPQQTAAQVAWAGGPQMHKSHKDPGWLLAVQPTAPHQQLLRLYCSCLQPAAPHSPPGRAARCAHGRRSYKPPMLLSALDPLPWATAGQVLSRLAAAWAAAAAPRGSDPLASSAVPGAPAWRGRCPALAGARGCLAAPPPLAGLGGAGGQGRIEGGRAAGGSWLRLSGVTARTVASARGCGTCNTDTRQRWLTWCGRLLHILCRASLPLRRSAVGACGSGAAAAQLLPGSLDLGVAPWVLASRFFAAWEATGSCSLLLEATEFLSTRPRRAQGRQRLQNGCDRPHGDCGSSLSRLTSSPGAYYVQ